MVGENVLHESFEDGAVLELGRGRDLAGEQLVKVRRLEGKDFLELGSLGGSHGLEIFVREGAEDDVEFKETALSGAPQKLLLHTLQLRGGDFRSRCELSVPSK